jgi:hypothetical protein
MAAECTQSWLISDGSMELQFTVLETISVSIMRVYVMSGMTAVVFVPVGA